MLGHVHAVATVDAVGVVGAGGGVDGSLRGCRRCAVQSVGLRRHRYRYGMLVVQVVLLLLRLANTDVVGLGIYRHRMVSIMLDQGRLVVVMRQWDWVGRHRG
jgi:hypothetical protein